MSLAENLKRFRKAAHLTQVELSIKSGVSQQAISTIERKAHLPNISTISLLADALNCTLDDLL